MAFVNDKTVDDSDHTFEYPADAGDLTELIGHWVNTNADSNSLVKLAIECDPQGVFWLQVFGASATGAVDWGRVRMDVHVAGRRQCGFHACYYLDNIRTELAANYKLGILVIQLFRQADDGAAGTGFIERDFFRSLDPVATIFDVDNRRQNARVDDVGPIDLAPYAGDWINSSPNPDWLRGLRLLNRETQWYLQASTIGGESLDPVMLSGYRDNMGYLAFRTAYSLGDRQVVLAFNTQIELLVLCSIHRFTDAARSSTMQRQVLHRR